MACVIPFTGGTAKRKLNFQIVHDYWSERFAVFTSDGFSIGDARNRAALKAIQAGYEYLFFVDADIIFPAKNVTLATEVAITTGSGVYPYGLLTRLTGCEEKEFLENFTAKPHDGVAEAGALVISSQAFIAVCGFPDLSWGEDAIFHNACASILGPITRVWEDAFHLWHEPSSPDWDPRLHQMIRASEQAIPYPSKMKALIERSRYYDVATFVSLGYARGCA